MSTGRILCFHFKIKNAFGNITPTNGHTRLMGTASIKEQLYMYHFLWATVDAFYRL